MREPRFRQGQRVAVVHDESGRVLYHERVQGVGRQVVTGKRSGPFLALHFWHSRCGRGIGAWRGYSITETRR